MLRIEQMVSSDNQTYVVIDLELNGTVKFHGVFESREDIDESTLKPMQNGLKMEIGLED